MFDYDFTPPRKVVYSIEPLVRRPWIAPPVSLQPGALVFRNVGQLPAVGLLIDARPVSNERDAAIVRHEILDRIVAVFDPQDTANLLQPGGDRAAPFDRMAGLLAFEERSLKPGDLIAGGVVYGKHGSGDVYRTGFVALIGEEGGALVLDEVRGFGIT